MKQKNRSLFHRILVICLAALILLLPGCGQKQGNTPLPTEPAPVAAEYLLAAPVLPKMAAFPTDESDWQKWSAQEQAWQECREAIHNAPQGYADSLSDFWQTSIPVYLAKNGGNNAVYSPINLYMALAILAQTTDGETRQEILTLLGADSMESLAAQAKYVFQNQYENDGVHTCILANSLWLDDMFTFHPDAVKQIAENYYASVYQGALESPEMNAALKDWLNEQTGGLLKDSINNLPTMNSLTALVIASTINYRCKWRNTFYEDQNTQNVFHGTQGEQTITYLNQTIDSGSYYQADNFAATYLPLDGGSRMWLILPDVGVTPEDLLQNGQALSVLGDELTPQRLRVNLSVPKFDITADLDLIEGLKAMGIRAVFTDGVADFSPICAEPLHLAQAKQGVRVSIDEEGLTGVAYTVLMAENTAAMPLEDEVDFIVDRPFLFVVESRDGLPLFSGIVNQP